jgi:hypothetical protein
VYQVSVDSLILTEFFMTTEPENPELTDKGITEGYRKLETEQLAA